VTLRGHGPFPAASTRLVVLLGWPTRHSLSPAMHNAAFAEQELDLVYVALPTPPDRLHDVVDALGAVGAVGANVTVPHKVAAVGLCDELTDEATLVGAVNTLVWTADGLRGDNTDATGLRRDLVDLDLDRLPAVLLGTGGAARACAVALGRLAVPVTVVGRRADAAQEVADLAGEAGSPEADAVDLADVRWVEAAVARARLVVNATPLGMDDERLPEPFHTLGGEHAAYDLVYRAAETPFLRDARRGGARTHNGVGMLVAQAADAYERWTGQQAPTATMSAVATAAVVVTPPHGDQA
jgi:shikimate dehydrogenase